MGEAAEDRLDTPITDADEPADDGVFDRAYVKSTAVNTMRKMLKHNKTDESKAMVATM